MLSKTRFYGYSVNVELALSKPEYVYFAQDLATKHIKIGRSANVAARLNQLNISSPSGIKLVGTITCPKCSVGEKFMHSLFEEHKIRGEWFKIKINIVNSFTSNFAITWLLWQEAFKSFRSVDFSNDINDCFATIDDLQEYQNSRILKKISILDTVWSHPALLSASFLKGNLSKIEKRFKLANELFTDLLSFYLALFGTFAGTTVTPDVIVATGKNFGTELFTVNDFKGLPLARTIVKRAVATGYHFSFMEMMDLLFIASQFANPFTEADENLWHTLEEIYSSRLS